MLTKNDFRLRINENIVGYQRQSGNYTFYSKDLFHWSGKPIDYLQKDRCTTYKDRDDKWLFEEDIIQSTDYPSKCYIVTFDTLLTKFLLVELQDEVIFDQSFELFFKDKRKIQRLSFRFIN
ncbi:MAG: hypothetical protein WED10_03080 [Brumimicrobium sp.]